MSKIDIEYVARELGPEGPGFAYIPAIISPDTNKSISEELQQPLPWAPQYNHYKNQRNIEVTQAFDVLAHKFRRGDQSLLEKLPAFQSLGTLVTKEIVEPLASFFPTLTDWELDELSAQRYPADKGVLTWHRDLARHPGVIAICNIVGKATLAVRHAGKEISNDLFAGDVIVLRAPGLFEKNFITDDIRPEHAVISVNSSKERISITARANSKPDIGIKNFYYHNWQP